MSSAGLGPAAVAGACCAAAAAGVAVGALVAMRTGPDGADGADVPAAAEAKLTPQLSYPYSAVGDATPLAPHTSKPSRAAEGERSHSTSSVAEVCRRVAAATSSDLTLVPSLEQPAALTAAAASAPSPVTADMPGLTAPPGATLRRPSEGDATDAPAQVSRPVILGVGGASGSGKTSMNRILSASLPGLKVASISGDNYYIPLGEGVDPTNYNFDAPAAIDFALLAVHLRELRAGKAAEIPQYDFTTHSRLADTTRVDGVHVIIVDGIFTLAVEEIRELCDFTVFTLEDLDVCLARRLKRDISQRGRTVTDVLEQYERFVKPGYHMYVAPTMRFANLIVPRVRDNTQTLAMLVEYLRHRVAALNPEARGRALRVEPEAVMSAAANGTRRPSLFDPDQ
ncbi:hypothetical protein FNF27_00223 [Cafeteria roenbergensis]|uniref:uridine/cytidine kinase n=1 Tax=Cafeteria roenbergensis TaxID=33653 RepID=A0A5A8CS50_CAFRO|nr:hypothetical protein FNF29_01354 [Cafeteria roenbergensis]KAA0158636.1 hypothetical protein FNF31_05283 [Cafeteria roenbergensis]KAA0171856.1 hypothetical protein FNF28_00491 [Cafeteria roenbergensis]KAA0178373.1 hypothetical protein FNF27_00223 [Cafeteria roenbergensis]|eukprot:KAA0155935.1 hypothetical protein FNF29_01354 [Cafeteria roenbergensis]